MKREQFEKIIEEINNAKAESIYCVEDLCDLFSKVEPKLVEEDLDKDEHRWYEITTSVYKVDEWFLGIRGASKLYSEQSSWSDLCVETEAFEMEEVSSVTYRKKQSN